MPDSVSYGPEPGFLYSDGMSGGTDFFFVNPCDVYPSRPGCRAKARKAVPPRRRDPRRPASLTLGSFAGYLSGLFSVWGPCLNTPRRGQSRGSDKAVSGSCEPCAGSVWGSSVGRFFVLGVTFS